jgi:hypothetical protein
MKRSAFVIVMLSAIGLMAATSNYVHRMVVQDTYGSPPTCAIATGDGELCVENDIEANGNLDIAGTSTLTGAVVMSGALAVTGDLTQTGGLRAVGGSIADTTALGADDCGHAFAVTAGIDTKTITLPDADQVLGCELTFSYVGADAGALVDITPLDSDADGIEGGCYETATDTIIYFSGAADADIGLTKATSLTGDYIKLWACGAAMWCVVGCQGIWANN